MQIFGDVLEGVVGRQVFGNEQVGSAISEAGEAVSGGCLGIVMSFILFFLSFFLGFIFLFGGVVLNGTTYTLSWWTLPAIGLLLISGVASPAVGVLVGVRLGKYSIIAHIMYFAIYVGLVMGYIALFANGIPFI